MGKLISLIVSGVLGCALAGFAAWGVVSANTSAPDHNPAHAQSINYGQR